MEDQFRELYELSTVPDDDSVRMATEQLVELYHNPESIFSLIILLNPREEIKLRKAAAIGLKATLQICWEIISSSEHLQGLKDSMIELLSNEQDYIMRHIILDAMSPIFFTEVENWPQLNEYIESLSNETDESSIELFLSIFTAIFRYLPLDFIASLFDNLLAKAKTALSTQSNQVILAGSHLLRAILNLISTEQEIMASIIMEMLETFYILLKNNSQIAGEILDDICSILTDNEIEGIEALLQQYYTLISDEEIPVDNRCVCSQLLCTLIEQYPKVIEPESGQIIAVTLELASLAVVEDECFDSQFDVLYAVSPIEYLAINTSPDNFFAEFWENIQIDTPNKLLAISTAVNSFIEHLPEIISLNFSDIFDFSIGCIQSQDHCIQESGFSIIFQLIPRYYSLFSDLFDKFMECVLPILAESDHEPLVIVTLSSITELLYLIEVPDSYIEPLLENFGTLISKVTPTNQYLIISAISSLIYSSEDSIKEQQVAPELVSILQQAASHDPSEQSIIAASGVEALSYLISFSPSETNSIHQFTLEKIQEFLQLEDVSLFSTMMISLRSLITSEASDFIDNVDSDILFNSMIKIIVFDLDTIDKDTAEYSAMAESKKTTFLFLAKLASIKPNIVIPYISNLAPLAINHLDLKMDNYYVLKSSLKATISIAQLLSNADDNEVFESFTEKLIGILMENFESQNQKTTSLSFYGFGRLIDLGLQLKEQIMTETVNSAISTLESIFDCSQDDDCGESFADDEEGGGVGFGVNEDQSMIGAYLSDEVFGFLAILAQKQPQHFPLEDFFNFTQQAYEKWKNDELEVQKVGILVESIGVLCELFAVSAVSFPSLFKITLRQWFFESLKIVEDFEFPPHPLAAVRCFIEVENAVNDEELSAIVSTAESTFSAEFLGQTYYSNTLSSVISLLFSVIRIIVSSQIENESFDIAKFMPQMLELLPNHLCSSEAENIIVSLCFCAEKIQGFVQSYGQELLRILASVLGMKRRKLAKLKISENVIVQSIQLINELCQDEQDSMALIAEWLDKFALTRFQERISSQ